MRQNRVHLMPPMSNFYARICVKATPSSNNYYSRRACIVPICIFILQIIVLKQEILKKRHKILICTRHARTSAKARANR